MSIQNDPTTLTAPRPPQEEGMQGAREMAGEVGTQAKALAGQAREQAMDLVDRTRDEVRQQAETRSHQMAESMRTWVQQLSALADGRPQEAGQMQQYLEQARTRLTSWADRLDQQGPNGIMQDVGRFARRRPGTFLALSAGAGFVLGRVVRGGAGAAKDQQPKGGNGRWSPGGTQFEYQPPIVPDAEVWT